MIIALKYYVVATLQVKFFDGFVHKTLKKLLIISNKEIWLS